MRRFGPFISALSAPNAWSSDRPSERAVVRAGKQGFLSSNVPTLSGSTQPE